MLLSDCLDLFIEKLQNEAKSNEYLNKLKEQDNYEEIRKASLCTRCFASARIKEA